MESDEKRNIKNRKSLVLQFTLCILPFALLAISGCASWQVDGAITQGRLELLYGDPKVALAHFQKAAELNPDYRLNFTLLAEGVWTYVGRAYYSSGRLAEARKALETARLRHADDDVAKLYLGLVLSRNGDRKRALTEIEAGLKGLAAWLDYIRYYHPWGHYWDPASSIRSEARRNLTLLKGQEVNWNEIVANVEWIGREIEIEIDRAEDDRRQDRERDSEGGNQP